MAAIKKVIKAVSTTIGEVLVVGGALGTTYVLGFLKGSGIRDGVKEAFDHIKKGADSVINQPAAETQEGEVNEEPQEETTETETPPIEVTTNQQED